MQLNNLLSIQRLLHESNCSFKFTNSYFLIKDKLTRAIFIQRLSDGDLYPLQLGNLVKNNKAYVALIEVNKHRHLAQKASSLSFTILN